MKKKELVILRVNKDLLDTNYQAVMSRMAENLKSIEKQTNIVFLILTDDAEVYRENNTNYKSMKKINKIIDKLNNKNNFSFKHIFDKIANNLKGKML